MPDDLPLRRLTDPRELRALAHPVRVRLVEELAFDGPLTATELAERLGESPANCSWHLRQLAKYGQVEEAGGGSGRRRPWRVVVQSQTWGEEEDDPVARAAGQAFADVLDARDREEYDAWRRREPGESPEWRRAAFVSRSFAWLTADELDELSNLFQEFGMRYVERFTDPSTRPPGSRPVRLTAAGFPTRPEEGS